MDGWDILNQELDLWRSHDRQATLWLRDDDACDVTDNLIKLCQIGDRYDIPLCLAVIPQKATQQLADYVQSNDNIMVMQHGISHTNHNTGNYNTSGYNTGGYKTGGPNTNVKKTELLDNIISVQDLYQAQRNMANLFKDRFCPVLVPPWNRIGANLAANLAQADFIGLSSFTAFKHERWVPNDPQTDIKRHDTHIDIIDWSTRHLALETAILDRLVNHLAARRQNQTTDVATGILTHHLVHDAPSWDFITTLCDMICRHRAACFMNPWDV